MINVNYSKTEARKKCLEALTWSFNCLSPLAQLLDILCHLVDDVDVGSQSTQVWPKSRTWSTIEVVFFLNIFEPSTCLFPVISQVMENTRRKIPGGNSLLLIITRKDTKWLASIYRLGFEVCWMDCSVIKTICAFYLI